MAISHVTAAAASRVLAHSKIPLQTVLRRYLLPVQSINGSTGSLLRGLDNSGEYHHRSTGLPSPVQFRFGPAADLFASQARLEARGRPTKRIDSDSDGNFSDDGGLTDDGDYSDFDSSDFSDYDDERLKQ